MPFSSDHNAWTQTIAAQRQGHNPDGRRTGDPLGDPPPDVVRRVLNAHKTGESVNQIMSDWKAGRESRQKFNDQLRRQARGGFTGDTEQALSPDSGAGSVRDADGQFADLDQAMRDAASQLVPGGIVPTEQGPPMDANSQIRAAYQRVVERREER